MSFVPAAYQHKPQHESILMLEKEIDLLEEELQQTELALNSFESEIRRSLQPQIVRLRELTSLYKAHKAAKKAKRLAQKRRGKNFKEPSGILRMAAIMPAGPVPAQAVQQELRRLYKEAIVLVHPDKFALEDASTNERATQLTTELNGLYKSGKLEELSDFHEHIISGNAMAHHSRHPGSIANPAALLAHLKKKKVQLDAQLAEYKASPTYTVLNTYKDPYTFIDELRIQFNERIQIMTKRTRKA